jgi:hypothetical protein
LVSGVLQQHSQQHSDYSELIYAFKKYLDNSENICKNSIVNMKCEAYLLVDELIMRFFSICKIIAYIVILFALALLPAVSSANNPVMSSTTATIPLEMTLDNMDCGGNPAPGYSGSSTFLLGAIGSPGGVTVLTGGAYILNAGYYGQDLMAPSNVSSIWTIPNGLGMSITLQWTAPGDNERDDINLSGSRFHISSTTVLASAQSPGFWNSKRDSADIIISTANVAAKALCTYRITGLTADTTYYFRIWTLDQAANWSDLSSGGTTYAQTMILSVYVMDTSTYNFGWQQTGISTISPNGVLVRNDGNVVETYKLRVGTGTIWPANTVWLSSTTAGINRFVLYGVFNSTTPASSDFKNNEGDDILTPYNVTASITNFSMGNNSGSAVQPFMEKPLLSDNTIWFKLSTPLQTSTTAEQIIPVIITATQSP